MADMPDSKNSHVSTMSQKTPRGIRHGPIIATLSRLGFGDQVSSKSQFPFPDRGGRGDCIRGD